MNLGQQAPRQDSFKIMDRVLEHSINFWDTANDYGRARGEGVTEQIIGRYFAQGGGRRDKVVLATRVYGDMGKSDMGNRPNISRLFVLHIPKAIEDSLYRLRPDTSTCGGYF
jgi:aryl-alcohol dehydrogenase-like predicted oxidoreductase